MHFKIFASLFCLVATVYVNTVEGQLTVVSLAVVVIAGVAIAKEKLIAAELHRNYITARPVHHEPAGYGHKRGKRQADDLDDTFGPMFDSALELDTDDCAKLMVCHVFEKSDDKLNPFEVKIQKLFANDLNKIEGKSSKAEYQLAAYVGSLKQSNLCQQRYPKCLTNPEQLVRF